MRIPARDTTGKFLPGKPKPIKRQQDHGAWYGVLMILLGYSILWNIALAWDNNQLRTGGTQFAAEIVKQALGGAYAR